MKISTLRKRIAGLTALLSVISLVGVNAENSITLLDGFTYVEAMSDNGRYVAGYNGEQGWLYDSETGEISELDLTVVYGLELKDVSNTGVVVGSVEGDMGTVPAVWTNGTLDTSAFAEQRSGLEYGWSAINCISGDGTIMAGYVGGGYDGTPYIIKNGETIQLQIPEIDPDGLAYAQTVPIAISMDNRYIVARLCNDYGQYRVGLWDLENLGVCEVITLAEPVLDWDGVTYFTPSVHPTAISPNGKIIAVCEDTGASYAYDIASGTISLTESPEVDADGYPISDAYTLTNAFGDCYVAYLSMGWGLMRTGYVRNADGEWVLMQDYFLETYGVDIAGAGFDDTGSMTCVSADECAFAGMSYFTYYDEDLEWDMTDFAGYHIRVEDNSGVDLVGAMKNKPVVVATDGMIKINGINGRADVTVTDMAGRTQAKAVASGSAQYSVGNGAYIVKVQQGINRYIYKVVAK